MIIEALFPQAVSPSPTDDFWYTDLAYDPLFGKSTVTPDTAMTVTAVYACVRVLAETVAQLPLHLMRLDGRSKYRATEHPLYEVLHSQPNGWQTSFEFREMMQGHLALRGNAYAQIRPGRRGAVDQLIPLHPARMEVFRLPNKRLGYLYRDKNLEPYRLTQDEVFHLRGLSSDGMVGLSPISLGRHAIELAQRSEEHGIKFFRNKAKPGGVLKMAPGTKLEEDDYARLKKSWREGHTGDDLYSIAILENGMEWQQVGISNEDSQWLESREYQVTEICRIFRMQPHKIAQLTRATFSNVEHQALEFVIDTMMPWVVRWEQAISRDLVTEPETFYPKFALEGLLRGDSKARGAFYRLLWNIGVLSINDIRELEDMNPIEGGDTHFVPLNMVPLEMAVTGEQPVKPASQPLLPKDESLALPPPGNSAQPEAFCDWIKGAAGRLANAEIRELEKRADKAAGDRPRFDRWISDHWSGRHYEYIVRTVNPILTTCGILGRPAKATAEDVASRLTLDAITELSENDPVAVLAAWRERRYSQLTDYLLEILNDG